MGHAAMWALEGRLKEWVEITYLVGLSTLSGHAVMWALDEGLKR